MSQLHAILTDIQTLLAGNSAGVKAYRSDYVPTQLGSKRDTGYLEWDLDIEGLEQNSREYTGIVFANLIVTAWAVSRTTRDTVYSSVLDLLMPVIDGRRKTVAPKQLTNTTLHYANLIDIRELSLTLEGHQTPETSGIYASFDLKLSYLVPGE